MAPNVNYHVNAGNAPTLKDFKLFAMLTARQDFLVENARRHGVDVELIEIDGWHDDKSVRDYLHILLPKLFQQPPLPAAGQGSPAGQPADDKSLCHGR